MTTFLSNKIEQVRNKTINGELLFFVALTLSLTASFIVNTTFMTYLRINMVNWVNYFAIALLVIKIYIFDKFKWQEYLAITVILFLAFLSWKKTQINSVMVMVAFICGAQRIDFDKIIRHYFNINLSLLLLIAAYSMLGVIRNLAFFRGDIYRYSFGIDYPTDLAAYIFYLCLAYCYLNYQKLNWQRWLGIVLVDILMYFITNTRVDAILILLIIPVVLLTKQPIKGKVRKFTVSSFWYLSIIFPYAYVLLTYYFNMHNPVMHLFDKLLSGRLIYGAQGFEKYGITLFGNKIIEHGWGGAKGLHMMQNNPFGYFFIDSSFVRFLIINGSIIGCVVFAVLIFISIRETIRHNYLLPAILFLVVLSSLIDQHLLEITYNPFLLSFLATVSFKTSGGLTSGKVKEVHSE